MMRLRIRSLRGRLTAAACLVLAPLLVVCAWLFTRGLNDRVSAQQDRAALAWADNLAEVALNSRLVSVVPTSDDDALAVVIAGDGTIMAATEGADVDRLAAVAGQARVEGGRYVGVAALGDRQTYALRVTTLSGPGRRVTAIAGFTTDEVSETLALARTLLAVGIVLLLALVGSVTWTVVGRVLAPVEHIRRQVDSITTNDLSRRVPLAGSAEELDRLAETMNRLLARIEAEADAQRRFIADASHELRSPLATSRVELDLLRSELNGRSVESIASLIEDNERMARLVDDLLTLASLEARAARDRSRLLDLDDIVRVASARLRRHDHVSFDLRAVSACEVRGDADELDRLVTNLFENAARYATTTVNVEVARRSATIELTVNDDGPGIPADVAERVFQRFARLDGARSRSSGGVGLGLAIAREIAEAHGGTLVVGRVTPGAQFRLSLPAASQGGAVLSPGAQELASIDA